MTFLVTKMFSFWPCIKRLVKCELKLIKVGSLRALKKEILVKKCQRFFCKLSNIDYKIIKYVVQDKIFNLYVILYYKADSFKPKLNVSKHLFSFKRES